MNDVPVSSLRKLSPLTRFLKSERCGSALLVVALSFIGTAQLKAVPYASALVNDNGTISFRLNESAGNVKIVSNGGATTNDLGELTAGAHSFSLGVAGTFQVVVFKVSPPGFVTPIAPNRGATLQISTDSPTLRFNNPRGLAVNKNPASPYFGRVYVSNSSSTNSPRAIGDGIYVLNPDLTDAVGQGDTALTGGLDFSASVTASPYRLTVGADDFLYVADWSDVSGSLYVTDANVAPGTGMNILGGAAGGPFPVTSTRIHGSIAAAVVEGSLFNGNLTAYVLDEDLQDNVATTTANQRQSLWRHDIGGTIPGPFQLPTRIALHPTTFLRGVGNQTVDLARGTNGSFFASNYRSTGVEANVWVVDSTGTLLWNSLVESRSLTGNQSTNDLLRATGALDVSPAQDFLALINIETNGITLLPLINGIPDLTNRLALNGFDTVTAQGRELAFDLAGNLYAASSGAGLLRAFSPGGTTTTITGSDGTFQVIRPPGVSVIATDADADEDGNPGVFTISRAGDASADLTVLYTLSGTAGNGTDFPTNVLSTVIPAGLTTVDVTVSPTDDALTEAPETVILTLVGTPEYDIKSPIIATISIGDNEPPVVSVTALDSNSYEAFPADKLSFQLQRIGATNTELFVTYLMEGTATKDIDYSALNGGFLPDTLYMAAGELSLILTLEPFEDTQVEGEETVTLALQPASAGDYLLSSPSTASAQLRDDEWSPATILFSDNFDVESGANWTTHFGANNGVLDATTQFSFNYSVFGIPAAPHSAGTTLGLFVTVNKDTTISSAGINLYPNGQSFSGDHTLRFDMFTSYGPSNSTEHALAGINHSGLFTNRVSQTPANHASTVGSDGIWFGIEAAAGNLRDYAAYSSTNLGTLPALITTRAATTVSNVVTRPPYAFGGSPGNASNSTTKAWSSVEISQVGNVVSLKMNQALILQVTNIYGFNSGNIMIGFNDQFESRGSDFNFVIFDNVEVVSTEVRIQSVRLIEGNQVQIDFIAPSGQPSDYHLQSTPGFSPADWDDEDGAVISARTDGAPGFRAVVNYSGPAKFYRIR